MTIIGFFGGAATSISLSRPNVIYLNYLDVHACNFVHSYISATVALIFDIILSVGYLILFVKPLMKPEQTITFKTKALQNALLSFIAISSTTVANISVFFYGQTEYHTVIVSTFYLYDTVINILASFAMTRAGWRKNRSLS